MPQDKRSGWRRLWDAARYPLSMLEAKHHPRRRRLSLLRVAVAACLLMFVRNWPTVWGPWEWGALVTILATLPVADLFAAVPVREGLDTFARIATAMATKQHQPSDGGGG